METEKVCVNLPAAELGKIDVLVAEGLFASRTDVIRAGIRTVLDQNIDAVQRVTEHSGFGARAWIGYQLLERSDLETAIRTRKPLQMVVVGVLRISSAITPELADEGVGRIRVFGAVRGPDAVLKAIGDRIVRGTERLEN